MKFWRYEIFWELLGNGVFLLIFSIFVIISLAVFRWLTNRKLNDNAIRYESLFITANTIFLVISMVGVALSGWYTIMYYCNL